MKYVKHLKKAEWGIGKVLDVSEHKITIDFMNGGIKLLNSRIALLEEIFDEGEIGKFKEDKLLTSLTNKKNKKTSFSEKVPLENLVKVFKEVYSGGFEDINYLEKERNNKVKISNEFKRLYSKENLKDIIQKDNYSEICERTKKLISATKIIHSIEKTNFRKAIGVKENQKEFIVTMCKFIEDDNLLNEETFLQLKDYFNSIDCNKWTLITYFLNMIYPEKYPFLKPKVSKKAAEIFGFDLNYNMIPNWSTYNSFLKYTEFLEKELVGLSPRDYLDVENFIWVTINNLNRK